MKKAVVYGRVSTDKKETGRTRVQDYGRQLYDLREYATRNNFEIVQEFAEKKSGTKMSRKELDRMLAYIEEHQIKNLLVTDIARVGRTGVKTRLLIEELANKGVNTYIHSMGMNTIDKDGKVNNNNLMLIGLFADQVKMERDNMVEKITSGLRYSASKGRAKSGKFVTYGYKTVDGFMVIDPEESKVVKKIFELYVDGFGCSKIAAYLNDRKVPTRYNKVAADQIININGGKLGKDFKWASGTITTMLKNPNYKGVRVHNDEVFNNIPPIIDATVFDQVQVMLKNRSNRPIRMIKNDNHLKDRIHCGVCGEGYTIHQRADGKDKAYKCLSTKHQYDKKIPYCGSPSIGIDKLLHSLYYMVSDLMIKKLRNSKSDRTKEIEKQIELKEIELQSFQNQIKKLSNKLDNLYDDYNERLVTKSKYIELKTDYEQKVKNNNDLADRVQKDLINLKQVLNHPLKNKYTYDQFLVEIKNIIKDVVIGNVEKELLPTCKRVFGEKNVYIKITVETLTGQTLNCVLGRYSKKIIVGSGSTSRMIRNIPDTKTDFEDMYDLTNDFDKLVRKLNNLG